MSTFELFQRKNHITRLPAAPTYPSLRPARSLTSPPRSAPEQVQPVTQAQLEHAARPGHSLERISILPPARETQTGMPNHLKEGVESLSGLSLNDVQVHYNSSQPAQVQALAYTQGTDIHLGPGQERHLAHEAWHVVQQKQGRVVPTMQAGYLAINDDTRLEDEANRAGEVLTSAYRGEVSSIAQRSVDSTRQRAEKPLQTSRVVQRQFTNKATGLTYILQVAEGKITVYDEKMAPRGFVTFYTKDGKFYLKTIDTKSDKGPPGTGALLVYRLATFAHGKGYKRIMVTNATPEETGFYLRVGFEPDPDNLKELEKSGMTGDQINKQKFYFLSGDVNALFNEAGSSVVKNWQNTGELYAGEHPEHGKMYHVPL